MGRLVSTGQKQSRGEPELTSGPLPPALAASSFLAFSSVGFGLVRTGWIWDANRLMVSYRRAASRGRPCLRRQGPCFASWQPVGVVCQSLIFDRRRRGDAGGLGGLADLEGLGFAACCD